MAGDQDEKRCVAHRWLTSEVHVTRAGADVAELCGDCLAVRYVPGHQPADVDDQATLRRPPLGLGR